MRTALFFLFIPFLILSLPYPIDFSIFLSRSNVENIYPWKKGAVDETGSGAVHRQGRYSRQEYQVSASMR